jgi:hypothetical protein
MRIVACDDGVLDHDAQVPGDDRVGGLVQGNNAVTAHCAPLA